MQRWAGHFYRFQDSAYRPISDEQLAALIYALLDRTDTLARDDENGGAVVTRPLSPRAALIREVLLALPSRGLLVDGDVPQWLDGRSGPPVGELVAVRNGLLHLRSRRLLPPTPDYFTLSASPVEWDPRAPRPRRWLEFLAQLFPDDAESIATLAKRTSSASSRTVS